MNFKELASNLGLDEEDIIELVGIFITTSYTDIEKITLGLKDKNAETVSQAAHSIKGAGANLGLIDISSVAKEIEMAAKDDKLTDLEKKAGYIIEQLKKIERLIETD